jgi:hypothetical protein
MNFVHLCEWTIRFLLNKNTFWHWSHGKVGKFKLFFASMITTTLKAIISIKNINFWTAKQKLENWKCSTPKICTKFVTLVTWALSFWPMRQFYSKRGKYWLNNRLRGGPIPSTKTLFKPKGCLNVLFEHRAIFQNILVQPVLYYNREPPGNITCTNTMQYSRIFLYNQCIITELKK